MDKKIISPLTLCTFSRKTYRNFYEFMLNFTNFIQSIKIPEKMVLIKDDKKYELSSTDYIYLYYQSYQYYDNKFFLLKTIYKCVDKNMDLLCTGSIKYDFETNVINTKTMKFKYLQFFGLKSSDLLAPRFLLKTTTLFRDLIYVKNDPLFM